MSDIKEKTKDAPTQGRTPQGQIVAETPRTIKPSIPSSYGLAYHYLGDPGTRYGYLIVGDRLSMSTKLKMLTDPVIAMSVAFISSKLVKAEYEIRCKDPAIKRFFEAMYASFHREFMLQAAMAVALGCCGLIKKFEFATPEPEETSAAPVWNQPATPYICTGFDQVNPVGASPSFDKDGDFKGFEYGEGKVDRIYALWLTISRAKVFGKYKGRGRLENAYKPWWIGEFGDDQLVIHIQRYVDRVVQVSHPPGKDKDGNDLSDLAIAAGDSIRSGATVALPSSVYAVEDEMGLQKLTTIRKWTATFMEGTENVAAFTGLNDHIATRKAMGMLIPLQLYQAVQQSALGGPTTSDVLGKLAVALLLEDATDADIHINKYLFPFLLSANFGPDAPPVTKHTTGLNEYDRGELFRLLEILVGKQAGEAEGRIDASTLIHRLGVPEQAYVAPPEPEPEPEPEPGEEGEEEPGEDEEEPETEEETVAEKPRRRGLVTAPGYDPKKNPSREVLEKILSERLGDDTDDAAIITPADIDRAVERLMDEVPEVANLETVEVIAEDKNAGA